MDYPIIRIGLDCYQEVQTKATFRQAITIMYTYVLYFDLPLDTLETILDEYGFTMKVACMYALYYKIME